MSGTKEKIKISPADKTELLAILSEMANIPEYKNPTSSSAQQVTFALNDLMNAIKKK